MKYGDYSVKGAKVAGNWMRDSGGRSASIQETPWRMLATWARLSGLLALADPKSREVA